MATEVLWPQDCFIERIRVSPHAISRRRIYDENRSSNHNNNNLNNYAPKARSSRKSATRTEKLPDQRRPIPVMSVSRRSSSDDLRTTAREKVTVLRRGESLNQFNNLVVMAANRGDQSVYAGSAFAMSPSPSALPLPSFSKKKDSSSPPAAVDTSATEDLRRLLRLE